MRLMCLVSKEIRGIVHRTIRSFTFTLDGEATMLLDHIRFLKHTQLDELRVIIPSGMCTPENPLQLRHIQ